MKHSITNQLLLWLLVPLLTVAVISTVVASLIGNSLARDIYDTQLLDSADSVIGRIRVKNDKLTVDLPPAALAILRHNYHDDFYYQIVSPDGKLLYGDKTLPLPPLKKTVLDFAAAQAALEAATPQQTAISAASQAQAALSAATVVQPNDPEFTEPHFRPVQLGNRQLRAVVVAAPHPDFPGGYVLVQAAETRKTRAELSDKITTGIFIVELLLIITGAASIWIGVKRGLLPLARVEKAVQSRSPADLSPLTVNEPVEVASIVRSLNRLLRQLSEDQEMQKRFIANAAHQLRTPLAVLSSYCDLAQKLTSEPEAQEALKDLDAGISRMSHMVRRLLSLARSEPNVAVSASNTKVDLNAVASNAMAAQAPEAIKKRLEIEFRGSPSPAVIYGDQERLEELVGNLIENSILYTPPKGDVIVSVIIERGGPMLVVEDTGPGIPEPERGRIFERFYRMPGTEQPGTGLGLAIVREIAYAHNAEISVNQGPQGIGSRIEVRFPAITMQSYGANGSEAQLLKKGQPYRILKGGLKKLNQNSPAREPGSANGSSSNPAGNPAGNQSSNQGNRA